MLKGFKLQTDLLYTPCDTRCSASLLGALACLCVSARRQASPDLTNFPVAGSILEIESKRFRTLGLVFLFSPINKKRLFWNFHQKRRFLILLLLF